MIIRSCRIILIISSCPRWSTLRNLPLNGNVNLIHSHTYMGYMRNNAVELKKFITTNLRTPPLSWMRKITLANTRLKHNKSCGKLTFRKLIPNISICTTIKYSSKLSTINGLNWRGSYIICKSCNYLNKLGCLS